MAPLVFWRLLAFGFWRLLAFELRVLAIKGTEFCFFWLLPQYNSTVLVAVFGDLHPGEARVRPHRESRPPEPRPWRLARARTNKVFGERSRDCSLLRLHQVYDYDSLLRLHRLHDSLLRSTSTARLRDVNYIMTNNDIIKNSGATSSSAESGYVTWLALLFVVVMNAEIDMLVSVFLEISMPIVFIHTCFVFVKIARVFSMFYLAYFWIKVFRKMLIYSTVMSVQQKKK